MPLASYPKQGVSDRGRPGFGEGLFGVLITVCGLKYVVYHYVVSGRVSRAAIWIN